MAEPWNCQVCWEHYDDPGEAAYNNYGYPTCPACGELEDVVQVEPEVCMTNRMRTLDGKLWQALPGEVGSPALYKEVRLDLCNCGGATCENDRSVYLCKGCSRWVPWCYGGADDLPEHCDDCWAEAHEKKDEEMAKKKREKACVTIDQKEHIQVTVDRDTQEALELRVGGSSTRLKKPVTKRLIDVLYRGTLHGLEETAGAGEVPMKRLRALANPSRDSVYAKMARELITHRGVEAALKKVRESRRPLNINEQIARDMDEEILKGFPSSNLKARLECPECGSEKVSHVEAATSWSSQCLACAHVWGSSAYTRCGDKPWETPDWVKQKVEAETLGNHTKAELIEMLTETQPLTRIEIETETEAPRFYWNIYR